MSPEDDSNIQRGDHAGRWSITLALAVGSAAALTAFLTWLVWTAFFAG